MGDVEKAAEEYHSAQAALEERRAALYDAIRTAAAEGIPAARIGRAANMSRERVRQIVESDAPPAAE